VTVAIDIAEGTMPKLAEHIASIRARLVDLETIMKRQALLLSTIIDDSFQNSRSPLGEGWAPLADSTVAKRRKGSSKPLVDTAQLRQASFASAKDSAIVFGTSGAPSKYGVFHVTGTKNMPRRAYLPLSENGRPDFSSGPARDWLAQTEERVINFILRDKK